MVKFQLQKFMKENIRSRKIRPIILIHGLWNSSEIFRHIINKLNEYKVEYFAPTLTHKFGMVSISELAYAFNKEVNNKFGQEEEIDIVGFSMGGIIGRYWIKKLEGYKRTKRFISIGSPHNGTFTAQIVPKYPFRGISEMKINSDLLNELSTDNNLLKDIDCISFYTMWDLMVFPGWRAYLPLSKKIPIKVFKHKNLVRNPIAVDKIVKQIINH